MFKKIFCVAFLMAAILFVGNAKVFAQDVWIHTDGKSGIEYYVITESIVSRSKRDMHCDANVKYVRNGALLATKKYSFDGHDVVRYKIDGVDQGYLDTPVEPAARAICHYCSNYISKHFDVVFTTGAG